MSQTFDPSQWHSLSNIAPLKQRIKALAAKVGPCKIMHICGSHEHEIVKWGIRQLLPPQIKIVPGPGCPVCVCPVEAIDLAVTLARVDGVTLACFGDMMAVPGSKESLSRAKSEGASLKVVYGPFDALKLAQENPDRQLVFFSVGFETTAAGVAGMIKAGVPDNLSFLMANRYMPPVLKLLMSVHDQSIQGFLLPGHAATITGLEPYRFMERNYKLPSVVSGFEPADILLGILNLLEQMEKGSFEVANAYRRAVQDRGNSRALSMMDQVFDLKAGIWRGIDVLEGSAFCLKKEYQALDAEHRFTQRPAYPPQPHPVGCECHRVMLGEIEPTDCRMFKKHCHPQNPIGPCMVSIEGTCRSWLQYGNLTHNA